MVAFYEKDPLAPRLPADKPWTKLFTRSVSSSSSSSSPGQEKCARVVNADAVVAVEPVVEKIGGSKGLVGKEEGEKKTKKKRKREGEGEEEKKKKKKKKERRAKMSLLSPLVFSPAFALNSGLTLTRRGVVSMIPLSLLSSLSSLLSSLFSLTHLSLQCSLNCGGKCESCKASSSSSSSSSSSASSVGGEGEGEEEEDGKGETMVAPRQQQGGQELFCLPCPPSSSSTSF